jgi:hypothetical protein
MRWKVLSFAIVGGLTLSGCSAFVPKLEMLQANFQSK